MIKNILFDLDGTLSDSGKSITESVAYALEKSGIDRSSFSLKDLEKFIGPPLQQSFQTFYGFSKEETMQAVDFFREYFNKIGILQNEMYSGVPQMLQSLQTLGYTLYVATSKPEIYAQKILEDFGIAHFFLDIVGSSLSHNADSSKITIIRTVLTNHSLLPETCIMIGDREHDIFGAHQCGMKAIGVLYGFGDKEELEAVNADYIVSTVPELTALLETIS